MAAYHSVVFARFAMSPKTITTFMSSLTQLSFIHVTQLASLSVASWMSVITATLNSTGPLCPASARCIHGPANTESVVPAANTSSTVKNAAQSTLPFAIATTPPLSLLVSFCPIRYLWNSHRLYVPGIWPPRNPADISSAADTRILLPSGDQQGSMMSHE